MKSLLGWKVFSTGCGEPCRPAIILGAWGWDEYSWIKASVFRVFWILPDIPWTLNVFTLFITEYYTEITSATLPDFCLTPAGYQDYQSFPVYNCSNFQCILQCVKGAKKSAQASCSWFCSVLSMIVGVEVPRSNWPLLPWSLRFKRHSLPACSPACIWLGQLQCCSSGLLYPCSSSWFLEILRLFIWGCIISLVFWSEGEESRCPWDSKRV